MEVIEKLYTQYNSWFVSLLLTDVLAVLFLLLGIGLASVNAFLVRLSPKVLKKADELLFIAFAVFAFNVLLSPFICLYHSLGFTHLLQSFPTPH